MGFLQKFHYKKSSQEHIDAIITNLRNILNIKKEFGALIKQLGVGDYNAHSSRDRIVERIIEEIQENIELYEPRVKLMDIKEVEGDNMFRVRFELQCVIIEDSRPIYIIFDSVYNHMMVEQ